VNNVSEVLLEFKCLLELEMVKHIESVQFIHYLAYNLHKACVSWAWVSKIRSQQVASPSLRGFSTKLVVNQVFHMDVRLCQSPSKSLSVLKAVTIVSHGGYHIG
jgi:hypothetical protein